MKKPNNRICYDMCDDCGSSETIYYKHKDGGVYEVLGYCSTYVDGVTLNLIAYRPKGDVTRYDSAISEEEVYKLLNTGYFTTYSDEFYFF